MNIGRIVRLFLLAACVVLGWIYFSHWDAYQLPDRPGDFLDPSSGERFKEHTLEMQFFRLAPVLLLTIIVYIVHWVRSKRFTL